MIIGAPELHGHSVEKTGPEGNEKEGTRVLNSFGGFFLGAEIEIMTEFGHLRADGGAILLFRKLFQRGTEAG